MSFPRFAGGKFLSNCLALSRHCVPQDPTAAEYLLVRPDDYQYRLSCVMKTLPPDEKRMADWIPKYEFGDRQLYGDTWQNWQKGIRDDDLNHITRRIIDAKLKTFFTAHGGDRDVSKLHRVWPRASIIKLINHKKFSTIAWALKSDRSQDLDLLAGNYCETRYKQLSGPDWPDWKTFESVGYDIRRIDNVEDGIKKEIMQFYNWTDIAAPCFDFDVDACYFNEERFLKSCHELYEWLQFDDFDPTLLSVFFRAFMSLHKPYH